MNQDAIGAEFSALTEDEQVMLVGGSELSESLGWVVGYTASVVAQAIVVGNKLSTGQTVYYIQGSGWF